MSLHPEGQAKVDQKGAGIAACDHDYSPDGTFSGGCVIMHCHLCGDEYERDVS